MRSRERGYSIAEILVVVAIVGVLSMAAIPSFLSFTRANQIRTASRQFTTDVRALRQLCVTRLIRGKVTFTTGSSQYTYTLMTSPSTGTPVWTVYKQKEFEKTVFFESTTFADFDSDSKTDIMIAPSGTFQNPDNTFSTGDVVLRTRWNVAWNRYTLRFNSVGNVTVITTHV